MAHRFRQHPQHRSYPISIASIRAFETELNSLKITKTAASVCRDKHLSYLYPTKNIIAKIQLTPVISPHISTLLRLVFELFGSLPVYLPVAQQASYAPP